MDHNELRDRIHIGNVNAGWWSDFKTGESILATRNRPEMLCLIVSELVEAWQDGFQPDGHLPQYIAFNVEIADTAIRILDLAGGDEIDLTKGVSQPVTGNLLNDVMSVIALIGGNALEGYRKTKTADYHQAVADAYATLWNIAKIYRFDLMEVIDAKAAYNANRADHKIENRKAEGGKIC
jgi:hypothetical protein